jgi:hypothetical protein
MSIKPYVYRYVPGAANTASHLNGIKRAAEKSQELGRSWLVASDTGTGTTRVLTIGHKSEPYLLRLQASSTTDIICSFSHDGVNFSNGLEFCGDFAFNNSGFGTATDKAWVVETDDSFSVYSKASGTNQSTSPAYADALGFSCHAGKIATADNLNDDEQTGTFGLLCGLAAPIAISPNVNHRSLTLRADNPAQMLVRGQWVTIRTTKNFLRGINPTTAFFDGDQKYTAALADDDGVERLSPIRVYGATSGTVANLRYWRARNYAVAQSDVVGLIYSNDEAGPLGGCRQSSADPSIWWRHSTNTPVNSGGFQNVTHNTIYIWGDPSEMILV